MMKKEYFILSMNKEEKEHGLQTERLQIGHENRSHIRRLEALFLIRFCLIQGKATFKRHFF